MNKAQVKIFSDIFAIFESQYDYSPSSGRPLSLPVLNTTLLKMLLNTVKGHFSHEPMVLNINGPIVIIGDIHGHIFDLFRILKKYGKDENYLFLGDIIDRGEFSFETLTICFLLKAMNPNKVHIIRGNHEFPYLCTQMGFMNEVNQLYPGSKVFSDYMSVLSMIPLCAIINNDILCLHGGIGPNLESLEQIRSVQRPLELYDSNVINEILWSDPSTETKAFLPSPRGSGFLFGKDILAKTLNKLGMRCLIRGHNCVPNGVTEQFDGICYTVFSASSYCNKQDNEAGVLMVLENGEFEVQRFPPLAYVLRKETVFTPMQNGGHKTAISQQRTATQKKSPSLTLKSLSQKPPPGESNAARSLRGSSGNLLEKKTSSQTAKNVVHV